MDIRVNEEDNNWREIFQGSLSDYEDRECSRPPLETFIFNKPSAAKLARITFTGRNHERKAGFSFVKFDYIQPAPARCPWDKLCPKILEEKNAYTKHPTLVTLSSILTDKLCPEQLRTSRVAPEKYSLETYF